MVVLRGIVNGAGAEDPEGLMAKGLAVLLEEVAGVAAPALHVDGAAEDDGVVAVEALHGFRRLEADAEALRRSVAAIVLATSAVEPRFEA
jgi:hypothetical protein